MAIMRQVSLCKVLARFVKHGNLSCSLAFLKEVSFGHWKVTRGCDTFAFRHSSLGQADVRQLLESEAHHHKICPIGTGRLIAMVGVTPTDDRTRECCRCRTSSQHYAQNEQKQKTSCLQPEYIANAIPKAIEVAFQPRNSLQRISTKCCKHTTWTLGMASNPWMLPSIMTHLSCPRPSYCRTCGCLALLNLPVN